MADRPRVSAFNAHLAHFSGRNRRHKVLPWIVLRRQPLRRFSRSFSGGTYVAMDNASAKASRGRRPLRQRRRPCAQLLAIRSCSLRGGPGRTAGQGVGRWLRNRRSVPMSLFPQELFIRRRDPLTQGSDRATDGFRRWVLHTRPRAREALICVRMRREARLKPGSLKTCPRGSYARVRGAALRKQGRNDCHVEVPCLDCRASVEIENRMRGSLRGFLRA